MCAPVDADQCGKRCLMIGADHVRGDRAGIGQIFETSAIGLRHRRLRRCEISRAGIGAGEGIQYFDVRQAVTAVWLSLTASDGARQLRGVQVARTQASPLKAAAPSGRSDLAILWSPLALLNLSRSSKPPREAIDIAQHLVSTERAHEEAVLHRVCRDIPREMRPSDIIGRFVWLRLTAVGPARLTTHDSRARQGQTNM